MALKLGELVAYLRADDTALARGIRGAQDKLKAAGEKAREHGPLIGAALAAGIGAGLLQGLELDQARARLAAQVGDPAMAQQLGEVAGRIYGRGFGESAADAMQSARAVMQSGLLPKGADAAVIEDITVKARALSDVWEQDVTQTARAAGQMIRTGLAKNASEAMDIISAGFRETGDQAGDLLDSFTEYSTQFRFLGLSGAEAMGLMTQGVKAGARDMDVVADALKEFAIEAMQNSDKVAGGFKLIGMDADTAFKRLHKGGDSARAVVAEMIQKLQAIEDPGKRGAAAVELFGTKSEDLQAALMGLDLTTAAGSLGQVEGAADKLSNTLEQSSSQKLEAFKRQVQSALVDKLAEALPYIEGTFGWLKDNSGWVGPLATGLGLLAGIIGLVVLGTKLWAAAQIALNVAMMLNPVGLIILAVIGLIAVIVGLWMKFEGFRNFWKAVWDGIVAAFQWAVDWIVDGWTWVLDTVVALAKGWWELFTGFWGMVGQFFVDLLAGWWDLFTGFWSGVGDGIVSAWNWIKEKVGAFVDYVGGLGGKIKAKAKGMWDGIKDAFRSAVNWIIGKWNSLSFRIPPVSVPGLGQVWGGATLSTPNIPMLAKGGHILRAGTAVVGERGPELVHLGRGATVQPLTGGGAAGRGELTLRLIHQTPDGRVIREQLIDYASRVGVAPAALLPS